MSYRSLIQVLAILVVFQIGDGTAQTFSIFRNDSDTSTDAGRSVLISGDSIFVVNGIYCEESPLNSCSNIICYNKFGEQQWVSTLFDLPNFQRITISNDTITSITHGYPDPVDSTFTIKCIQYSTDGDSLRTVSTTFPDHSIEYWWDGVSSDADHYYAYGQKAYRLSLIHI